MSIIKPEAEYGKLLLMQESKTNWPLVFYCITITIFCVSVIMVNYHLQLRIREIVETNANTVAHFENEIEKLNASTKRLVETHREYQELHKDVFTTVRKILSERTGNENIYSSSSKNKKDN